MVAITTLTAHAPTLHTGGSAAHPSPAAAVQEAAAAAPATVVTLSDRAQQFMAEAKAAQAVSDIFALANGVAHSLAAQGAKPQVIVAHDAQTNEGLYILWSD